MRKESKHNTKKKHQTTGKNNKIEERDREELPKQPENN